MAGRFSAQKQFHLKPTPRSDRWALVSSKQITPGEVRAGLLLPEASCSWSLPFPFSPGIASNLCPGCVARSRAVTSDAGGPIAGILARFYGNRGWGPVDCNQ